MIDKLSRLFKNDAFIPTSAIFPSIDSDKLTRKLHLKEQGSERGHKDLPGTNEGPYDATEMSVIESIEEHRRKGLENYEANKEVYTKRISSASTAHLEVKSVTGTAQGDFEIEIKAYRAQMTGPVDDLINWHRALLNFRECHQLSRPAYENGNILAAAVILIVCVSVETVLNGYLFAQKNELGLLGGGMIALLVSIVNVTFSSVSGLFSRLSRHIHPLVKFGGVLIIISWVIMVIAFNLAIAHFRDAVETLDEWSLAATQSLDTLLLTPFSLESIESWLLMFWGLLIALIAFLKFIYFGEPYPGYARISRRYNLALESYSDQLNEALGSLKGKRGDAVSDLKEANKMVRENVSDAIDALYGHRLMNAHLKTFLQQCDLKATVLLKIYRDENIASRKSNSPKHFSKEYKFPPFSEPKMEMSQKEGAEKELSEINAIVNSAIDAIHEDYKRLKNDYPDPDNLIGLNMQTSMIGGNNQPHVEGDIAFENQPATRLNSPMVDSGKKDKS